MPKKSTKALYFEHLTDNGVKCLLCPHYCIIGEGRRGFCGVRMNDKGTLISLNYGHVTSLGIDPVEKKPLYHFHPGSGILSIGSYGCNMHCPFCQNYTISRIEYAGNYFEATPRDILENAEKTGSGYAAFTYNEPVVFFEFMLDSAKLLSGRGIKNVIVSNGQISAEPLDELLPWISAANIDIKSFKSDFYSRYAGGDLKTAKTTAERIFKAGKHLELTFLLIPGKNDDMSEFMKMTEWISSISKEIPFHISRYFPQYKETAPPTPEEQLVHFGKAAMKNLNFVYLGNTMMPGTSDTICPSCGKTVITRKGYTVKNTLKEGKCPYCGYSIYGEWDV